VGALAHGDRFVERGSARVVLAIGKQQDKISAVCAVEGTELVETRAVDAVENGCATRVALAIRAEPANACSQCHRIARPGLSTPD
jgi:CTP:molybdopterin cytidylyltransferase MocA